MKVHNFTASPRFKLEGLNSYYHIVGTKGDISNVYLISFLLLCIEIRINFFPEDKWWLGIRLGLSNNYENEMLQWVIGLSCITIPRSTLRVLTNKENSSFKYSKWKSNLLVGIYKKYGPCIPLKNEPQEVPENEYFEAYREVIIDN